MLNSEFRRAFHLARSVISAFCILNSALRCLSCDRCVACPRVYGEWTRARTSRHASGHRLQLSRSVLLAAGCRSSSTRPTAPWPGSARVAEQIPWFDGGKLDDIVDYLTYVFVPALFVWRAVLVPDKWTMPVAAAMLLSSAYGFSRKDAKTADHFFTGFPSYWNVVVFYLLVAGLSSWVNAAVLLAFIASCSSPFATSIHPEHRSCGSSRM